MQIGLKDQIKKTDRNIALVLDAHVTGLGIVRGLAGNRIPIVAMSFYRSPGIYSRHVDQRIIVDYLDNEQLLVEALLCIASQLKKKAVIFPAHDFHIRVLSNNYSQLSPYFHIPLNPSSVENTLSKEYQYKMCHQIGVPYPKTWVLRNADDIQALLRTKEDILYPLIVKPFSRARDPGLGSVFRLREIRDREELESFAEVLCQNLRDGFLVSEVIPGEPDNIWSYMAYCDQSCNVIAGWTGRKLTQRPYYYGVFSTARYERNDVVESQGRQLLKAIQHVGIGQPEFKYDRRDGLYKLTEINPRYMMWHEVGSIGGVNLPLVHYYHAVGDTVGLESLPRVQRDNIAHFVFFKHELGNILDHRPKRKYCRNAVRALLLPNKRFAFWDVCDPVPFLFYVLGMVRGALGKVLSRPKRWVLHRR